MFHNPLPTNAETQLAASLALANLEIADAPQTIQDKVVDASFTVAEAYIDCFPFPIFA